MSVKAKDVVKLLPKSKALVNRQTMKFFQGYNEAISQIGKRKLKLDRDKLAREIYCIRIGVNVNPKRWDEIGGDYKKQYHDFADALNEKLGDLLVCEE